MTTVEPNEKKRPGVNRIAVSGFKSIDDEQSMDFAPLTILAGANSSGKSSMMQALLLLKQTLDPSEPPAYLKLYGDYLKFSSADQVFFRSSDANRDSFYIRFDLDNNESLCFHFNKTSDGEIDIEKIVGRKGGREYILCEHPSEIVLDNLFTEFLCNRGTYLIPNSIERFVNKGKFFLKLYAEGIFIR